MVDIEYYDEQIWKRLDPKLVELGEKAELDRFQKMGVYDYVPRDIARPDPTGAIVKAEWVRMNKGVVASSRKFVVDWLLKDLGLWNDLMSCFWALRVSPSSISYCRLCPRRIFR